MVQLAQSEVAAQEKCSIVMELQMHLVNSPSGPVMFFFYFFSSSNWEIKLSISWISCILDAVHQSIENCKLRMWRGGRLHSKAFVKWCTCFLACCQTQRVQEQTNLNNNFPPPRYMCAMLRKILGAALAGGKSARKRRHGTVEAQGVWARVLWLWMVTSSLPLTWGGRKLTNIQIFLRWVSRGWFQTLLSDAQQEEEEQCP